MEKIEAIILSENLLIKFLQENKGEINKFFDTLNEKEVKVILWVDDVGRFLKKDYFTSTGIKINKLSLFASSSKLSSSNLAEAVEEASVAKSNSVLISQDKKNLFLAERAGLDFILISNQKKPYKTAKILNLEGLRAKFELNG